MLFICCHAVVSCHCKKKQILFGLLTVQQFNGLNIQPNVDSFFPCRVHEIKIPGTSSAYLKMNDKSLTKNTSEFNIFRCENVLRVAC